MTTQRFDLVLIAGAAAGIAALFAHGWLLPGFIVAGLMLALLAYFYGVESLQPPLSKEEEWAAWGVKWELDNPTPFIDTANPSKPQTRPKLHRGMP